MSDELLENTSLSVSEEVLPSVLVDTRGPGGIEAAVHDALQAAGLRQEMVAIVLVPLGTPSRSWPMPISIQRSSTRAAEPSEGLEIDVLGHQVSLHGRPVPLTVREFALLDYLYQRRGVVVTRGELLRDVWGERYAGGARTIDIHIRRLRAKLGADWVETTRGIGYKFRRRRDL